MASLPLSKQFSWASRLLTSQRAATSAVECISSEASFSPPNVPVKTEHALTSEGVKFSSGKEFVVPMSFILREPE